MLISFLAATALTLWTAGAFTLLRTERRTERKNDNYWRRQDQRLRERAAGYGVAWSSRETLTVWLGSLTVAFGLYRLTGNLLLFAAGWLLGVFLPSLLLKRRGERKRLEDLEDLTDCLRQLVARLPDQASFTRALEVQIAAQPGQRLTPVLIQVLEELRLGSGMTEAMELWRRRMRLKKFDNVVKTILQAQKEGWTSQAVKALDKAVAALERDLRAVRLAAQKAAGRKRQLYLTAATAWSFPLTLSLFSAEGGENVFLSTAPGQLLMAAYLLGTLYVLAKGQDYISLDVEEL